MAGFCPSSQALASSGKAGGLRFLRCAKLAWLTTVGVGLCFTNLTRFGAIGLQRAPGSPVQVLRRAAREGVNVDASHVLRVIKLDGTEVTYSAPVSSKLSTAWQLTEELLAEEEGGIEFDDYGGEFGHVAQSILGESNAADGSWFWALFVYGSFTQEWLRAPGRVDSTDLDTFPHIAWVAFRTFAVDRREEEQRVMRLLGSKPMKET